MSEEPKAEPERAPTIGAPLAPPRRTTWLRGQLAPVARCDGLMIGDVLVADECTWRAGGGLFGPRGAELKREATRHTERTGHVVVIEQVNRTVISPDDARDVLVDAPAAAVPAAEPAGYPDVTPDGVSTVWPGRAGG